MDETVRAIEDWFANNPEPYKDSKTRLLAASFESTAVVPTEQAELVDAWLVELQRRHQMCESLLGGIPRTVCAKGPFLRAVYPGSWVRTYRDLDLIALDDSAFWIGFIFLLQGGWHLTQLSVTSRKGRFRFFAEFRESYSVDSRIPILAVDLSNFVSYDSPVGIESQAFHRHLKAYPKCLHAVAIADELRQRSISRRDAIDLLLLLREASEEQLQIVRSALKLFGLQHEWNQLHTQMKEMKSNGNAPDRFSIIESTLGALRFKAWCHRLRLADGVERVSLVFQESPLRSNKSKLAMLRSRLSDMLVILGLRLGSVHGLRFADATFVPNASSHLSRSADALAITTPVGRFVVC